MVQLTTFMKNLDEAAVLSEVRRLNEQGADPIKILAALQDGMRQVGEEYEAENYFLSELIMSATIFKQAVEGVKKRMSAEDESDSKDGTYVIGTVKGDIHDIGKDIVANLLGCQGFKVVDLGVDQPAEAFMEAIKTHHPSVVGLSCLLTSAFESLKGTVDAIQNAGLRTDLSIMIGGAAITADACKYVGADAFCPDANSAVITAQKLAGGST